MRGLSGSISGLIQQCKVFSYSYCLLLLLQLRVVASVGGAHRFEIQTFRAVNGSDEFTVASCLSDVAFGYRPVTWRLNGLSVDFATNTRFSSSSKADAHSTRFFLQIKSPLSSDNGTVVTCQPDGYKESDAALFIVYDSAPVVEAIGDADVTVEEETLFQPRVRIFFSGGNLYLMYYQNEMQLGLETNVNGVYGTKDVSLSPLKVLKGMSGPLSVLVSLDGLPFSYPIFNLTVISRTVATPTAAFTSPSSDDGDPTTKSIGNSNSSSNSSSSAKYTTPAITRSPPPTSTSPPSTSAYDNSSLAPFTSESLDKNSTSLAVIAGSISGGVLLLVILVVALVLIYAKLRNKKSASIDDPLRRIGQSEIVYDEERDFLGSGCSGEVYRARLRKSSEVVAIKVFLKRRILPRQSTLLDKEARILLRIKPHPHILSLIGISASPRFYALVMEYIGDGDLFQVLTSTDDRSIELWDNRLDIANQIALGMSHLHKNEPTIIHLDLKSNNVLVNKKTRGGRTIYICKICDFGLAKMTNVSSVTQYRQEGQTPGGTVTYIAPERYQLVTYGTEDGKEKREIAKKSDVFSYGILLWEIKERDRPYEGMPNEAIHLRTKEGCPLPKGKVEAPRDYTSLLSNCVRFNPLERPSFDEIVSFLGTKQTTL
ncbi:probable serine/threonine-protein kinase drkC isoform X2 [Oscarella lobularis]|uniref:probable serine/threonine-protein kinase drkC isoform X2 n=1 Tax=Oscarella lobularis TaxID=121494 RepID=UPI003313436A